MKREYDFCRVNEPAHPPTPGFMVSWVFYIVRLIGVS